MIVYRKGDTLIMNGENQSCVEWILQRLTKLEQALSVDELTNEITYILGFSENIQRLTGFFFVIKLKIIGLSLQMLLNGRMRMLNHGMKNLILFLK